MSLCLLLDAWIIVTQVLNVETVTTSFVKEKSLIVSLSKNDADSYGEKKVQDQGLYGLCFFVSGL